MSNPNALVQELWNCCNVVRDDRLSGGVAEVERRLSLMAELEAVVSANLQRATRLRQTILPKDFTGKLV